MNRNDYMRDVMRRMKKDHFAVVELEVKPDTEQVLEMTPKQKAFAEIYVSRDDLTITQVAIEAGYNPNCARNMGHGLLRHPNVSRYIKALRQELNKKYEVTFENHVRKLAEIRDLAMQNGAYAAAVTAEKHRGQVAALYVERKEILHGRLDQMSREEVMKEIAKLKEELPGLSAILETNMVIEHQPAVEVSSGQEAREQVQPETIESDKQSGPLDAD
jgi:hypothetical protein